MRDNKAEVVGLVITGALIGASLGLLLAPQSGERTRKQIRRKARRGIERLDELQGDIREQVNGWVEDVADAVDDGLSRGKRVTVAGRERVLSAFDDARHRVDQGRTRIEQLLGSSD
jgi:gas vesicle protein